jgi:hypothetical protein
LALVDETSSEPAGLLVIRIWIEGTRAHGFRARITSTVDLESREEFVTVAGSPEAVHDAVDAWLSAFLSRRGT